jgi:acyl-coenzyme A synthetase/AMP-(fatty) acid ligase
MPGDHMSDAIRISADSAALPIAIGNAGICTRADFIDHVLATAAVLPGGPFTINLCRDRYHFLVGFVAAIKRGQTNLLPSNQQPGTIETLLANHTGAYVMDDEMIFCDEPTSRASRDLLLDPDHIAAIAFTSGSTGAPQPQPKPLHSLYRSVLLAGPRFGVDRGINLVATVPHQHMFGLETAILYPLFGNACAHRNHPFFPQDVADALADLPTPRALITTPLHLRALCDGIDELPPLDYILSATAPMPNELATRAEQQFNTHVLEIYGCTEAGSLATRRSTEGSLWTLHDGIEISGSNDAPRVAGGYLVSPIKLGDRVEIRNPQQFELRGRHGDMINVAGKRASLQELNQRLLAIPGVEDGLFIQPDEKSVGVQRLSCLVVAPKVTARAITVALKQHIDPLFLPRPIHFVDQLPRNETGKLSRRDLDTLLAQLGHGRNQ